MTNKKTIIKLIDEKLVSLLSESPDEINLKEVERYRRLRNEDWIVKWFKTSTLALIIFGWTHFLSDKLIYKLFPASYFKIKKYIGWITLGLTLSIALSIVFIIIKAF